MPQRQIYLKQRETQACFIMLKNYIAFEFNLYSALYGINISLQSFIGNGIFVLLQKVTIFLKSLSFSLWNQILCHWNLGSAAVCICVNYFTSLTFKIFNCKMRFWKAGVVYNTIQHIFSNVQQGLRQQCSCLRYKFICITNSVISY